jgi:hypothetical protein
MLSRWLQSIRLNTRLALIALLFALPFSCLTIWLLVKGINASIQFAEQERRGTTVQRPLQSLLHALNDYYLHAAGVTVGDEPALRAAVETAFGSVERVLHEHGEALQFTRSGLAERKKEHLAPSSVRSRWQELGAAPQPAALAAIVTDVRGMIGHMGDTSNLILDPIWTATTRWT